MSKQSKILDSLIKALPSIGSHHSPNSDLYDCLKLAARQEIETLFSDNELGDVIFYPLGQIFFPYFKMGNIDSLNLFDIDELIIFSYYSLNKDRYRNVLDVGANIGLHSTILGKCGLNVRSFEPDPVHFEKLSQNILRNGVDGTVTLYNAAVSSKEGELEFVRVLGNTTGSHLAGSKSDPYGELERFQVKVVPIKEHLAWANLVKLDAEGHEKEIIGATNPEDWEGKDAIIELSSKENAQFILSFFKGTRTKLYSQKINWNQVKSIDDMPFTHHDGSLFISSIKTSVW